MQRPRMTRDNTAVLLIDYQVGLLTDVRDMRAGSLADNVVGLANSAKELGLPIVSITTACDTLGPTMPELKKVLGRAQIMDRSDACATFTTSSRRSGIERLIVLDIEVCDCAVLLSELTAGEKADTGNAP